MAEITVTADNFESAVLNSPLPVLLDFWATWCGPCRMIAPALEEIAAEYEGRAVVGKVNVDDVPELAASFGIDSIPSLVIMKGGKPVARTVGYQPKSSIAAFLEKQL
mgnify:CR=1 FL=1